MADTDLALPSRVLSREDFLYPPLSPNRTGRLKLDSLHTMYWEESGNPRGAPVVFLHGGPGGGSAPDHRRFYDPVFYRIIVYDQRGAGQSTPLGALAYAQAHPDRVQGLVLRGIFLCRPLEIQWFLYEMRFIFPEAWRAFAGFLPEAERGDLLGGYYRRLTDPDPGVHMPAAHAWSRYEGSCSTLLPDPELMAHFDEDAVALAIARIEAHYFVHDIFLPENALLAGIERIRHLPCAIVQGRYDAVCPILSADELHLAWPEARYVVVADAGHSAREPGIARELVAATNRFR